MVAEAAAAPLLEAADRDLSQAADPALRQEDIVNVIGRPVLAPVAPVVGRYGLLTRELAAMSVIGADEAACRQARDGAGVVHAPARLVPDDVVVEVARDDRRAAFEKV